MGDATERAIRDPARLEALRRTALLDSEAEGAFDRLTRLAARVLRVPVALVSLVDGDRQFFKSSVGLPEPWASLRQTPLTHSFCKHVVASGRPLAIDDAAGHPLVCDNPAVAELGVAAYLGIPLVSTDGQVLGSFCVIDVSPRSWSPDEVADLRDLAASVMTEVHLRGEVEGHRRAEARLRLLESVVVNANDAVLITEAEPIDPPGPRVVYVNEAFTRMTGHRPEEVIGQTPRILQGPRTDRSQLDRIRSALLRWQPVRVELVNNRKDGSEFWVELSIVPVANEKGWYTHWVSVQRDITERKRAEAELRESDARLRAILETALDCVITIDHEGRVLEFNPAAERTFGYCRQDVLGRPMAELIVPPSLREQHRRGIAHYLATGEGPVLGRRVELPAMRSDGSEFPVELAITAVRQEGRPPFFTAYLRDIGGRKRAEAELLEAKETAEAASRAKSVFLSRTSHELRTPLNAVLGFAQLLGMDELSPDQRENVGQIARAGRHLLGLIDTVLDISRVESGERPPSLEPVRAGQVLTEAVSLARPLAAQAGVALDASGPAAGPAVLADRGQLRQVLLNLLSNAVKYNRPGGEVAAWCEEAGGLVRLAVRDTGPGIPADCLPRLFTPFDRLGAERSGVEGTGLGLALSRRLVEEMGGSLLVESETGRGCTFTVELPLAAGPAPHGPATPLPPTRAAGPGVRGAVLLVEDDPASRLLIEAALRHRPGVRLLSASSAQEGLELARGQRPDLAVLDLHLPDAGGDDLLGWLREDARTRATPVVVLSADATAGVAERLLATGAARYMTKPVDIGAFLALVDSFLRERRAES